MTSEDLRIVNSKRDAPVMKLKHEAADEGDVVATLRQAAHTQLAEINRAWRRSFSSIPLDRDVESAVNRDVLTRNI